MMSMMYLLYLCFALGVRADDRCGLDWHDANGKCGLKCPFGSRLDCPSGEWCYPGLSSAACAPSGECTCEESDTEECKTLGNDAGCGLAAKGVLQLNMGDCDTDSDCAADLKCGTDNCLWGDGDDCCYNPKDDPYRTDCEWYGRAPFCGNPQCPKGMRGELVAYNVKEVQDKIKIQGWHVLAKSGQKEAFGSRCWTGQKRWCCPQKEPSAIEKDAELHRMCLNSDYWPNRPTYGCYFKAMWKWKTWTKAGGWHRNDGEAVTMAETEQPSGFKTFDLLTYALASVGISAVVYYTWSTVFGKKKVGDSVYHTTQSDDL